MPNTVGEYQQDRYERLLLQAWRTCSVRPAAAVPPWESNPWLRQVLGVGARGGEGPALGPGLAPLATGPGSAAPATLALASSAPGRLGPAFARAVRCLRDGAWADLVEQRRAATLAKWFLLIGVDLCSFALGRDMVASSLSLVGESELQESLVDTFAGKSTGTLESRASAMMCFADWAVRTGRRPFPAKEADVYEYTRHLRESGSAPTKANTFLAASAFCGHVLGLDGALAAAASPRVRGAALRLADRKRPLAQRPPLSVDQANKPEAAVFDEPCVQDRVAAGFFVFMYLGRIRFSDAQAVESLEADFLPGTDPLFGFVEGKARRVKTGAAPGKRDRLLPMVAPAQGVHNRAWGPEWLKVRAAAGLSEGPGVPLLPAFRGGRWLQRPLQLGEASDLLRLLIARAGGAVPDDSQPLLALGTHSLKATTLSWAAKFGLPIEVRRQLGYHSQPGDKSVVTYSRDAAALPLRELGRVLSAVRARTFMPDCTRSGRFAECGTEQAKAKGPERRPASAGGRSRSPTEASASRSWTEAGSAGRAGPAAPRAGAKRPAPASSSPGRSSSSSSSSGSSSSSSSCRSIGDEAGVRDATERVARAFATSAGRAAAGDRGEVVWEHSASGCCHLGKATDEERLACGRPRGPAYARSAKVFMWPRCRQCFGTLSGDGPQAPQ